MRNIFKSKYDILKQKAYIIIHGTSTPAGKLFDLILLAVIVLSVILVMLESVKNINLRIHTWLVVFEWIITAFFTLEYILRIMSNPRKKWDYIFSLYGIVDLISLLPWYLSFFFPEAKFLSVFRIVRLLRIFRILELFHFTEQANQMKNALMASKTKILIFIYFMFVLCVFFGALMYTIEPHDSAFTSIPRSIYWCIVTLTTVGYGDVVPSTPFGQMMASIIMLLGYGIIAVPTGIVTSAYAKQMKDKEKHKEHTIINTFSSKNKDCKACGEKNLPENAKFCHNCGQKL